MTKFQEINKFKLKSTKNRFFFFLNTELSCFFMKSFNFFSIIKNCLTGFEVQIQDNKRRCARLPDGNDDR